MGLQRPPYMVLRRERNTIWRWHDLAGTMARLDYRSGRPKFRSPFVCRVSLAAGLENREHSSRFGQNPGNPGAMVQENEAEKMSPR